MKITSTILSIPPYISTLWKNVSTIQVTDKYDDLYTLLISLKDKKEVLIPNLDKESVDEIFDAHAKSNDEKTLPDLSSVLDSPFSFTLPLKPSGGALDSISSPLEHNPNQANIPPIPPEILSKIAKIAKAFGLDELQLPKAEPHCNCIYCQMSRSIQNRSEAPIEEIDVVDDEELSFRNWDIEEVSEKLYTVTNVLDKNEQYNVYLGEPLGCTCGSKTCEHIHAVLTT